MHRFIFLKTTEEHLEGGDHCGSISGNDFALGPEFWLA
jgi:hypothetical protein